MQKPHAAIGNIENLIEVCAAMINRIKPFAILTAFMIRVAPSKVPTLKLNAAEGRDFVPVILEVLRVGFPSRTDNNKFA